MTWSVPAAQSHELPGAREFFGQVADRQILDQHAEQPLIEAVREMKFLETPTRTSQAFETRNNTASQRLAASMSARSQRSPAAMPAADRDRGKFRLSSRCSRANREAQRPSALFVLEWLKKMRDTVTAPEGNSRPESSLKMQVAIVSRRDGQQLAICFARRGL